MANFTMDVVALGKASTEYDTLQQSIYSTLRTMNAEITAAVSSLKGGAVNSFSSAKALWDKNAADLHMTLDATGARLGSSAKNAAVNETAVASSFKAASVEPGTVYTAPSGTRAEAMAEITSIPTNIMFNVGVVTGISGNLLAGRNKLRSDLDRINAVAKASAAYWEAGSQTNYAGFATKTNTQYEGIDEAIRQMTTNVDTWQTQSSATESTNAGMWG